VKTSIKLILLGLVIVLAAVGASANPLDPGIIIKDPVCTQPCPTITSNTWSFNAPQSGFGFLHFINGTGSTWTSLIITELGVAAQNISCQPSQAFTCIVNPFGQNGAQLIFTAGGGLTGIPNGGIIEIGLSCNPTCWPGGLQFNVVANAVPEPGTMVLLLGGLGAIYARKKRAKRAPQIA
jgi:PEP-CTERM motif